MQYLRLSCWDAVIYARSALGPCLVVKDLEACCFAPLLGAVLRRQQLTQSCFGFTGEAASTNCTPV